MTTQKKVLIGAGAVAGGLVIYFGFIKKDAAGLTGWAKLMGKTNPSFKTATNPNSDEVPVSHEATGKKPRSKETYTDSKGNVWMRGN